MSEEKKAETIKIAKRMLEFATAKCAEMTPEAAKINARYLADRNYSSAQVFKAMSEMFGKNIKYPLASEIINHLKPSPQKIKLESRQVAGMIIEAISSFGQYQANEAKEYLGDVAWHVVKRFGGWGHLTSLTYSELGTARAQLTGLSESVLARHAEFNLSAIDFTENEKRSSKLSRPNFNLITGEKEREKSI